MINLASLEHAIVQEAYRYGRAHPEETVPSYLSILLYAKQLMDQELSKLPQDRHVQSLRGQLVADIVRLTALKYQEKVMKRFAKHEDAQ